VLERWRAGQAATAAGATGSAASPGSPAAAAHAAGEPDAPLATGVAAIRGEIPDTTGSAYGVFGITHSAAGAGVVARNQSTGPDLILDGEAQGEPDTLLTQSGLDRPSAGAATFNLQNSGAGALTLQVDGVAVDTALTPIAWSRLASVPAGFADGVDNDILYTAGNQLALDGGSSFNVVEGPGSDLDADLLDGLHAGAFAASAHLHPGEAIASGTVAEDRIAAALARDSEVLPIVLAGDGSGSGLDADLLDGLHASAVQARVTGVCPAGEAMQGVNADGTVVCYLMPVPPKRSSVDVTRGPVSIAIGGNGFPVISYVGSGGSFGYSSRLAICNDAACSGGDETLLQLDSSSVDSMGRQNSIAVGDDGFPVISYYNETAKSLRVARCQDSICSTRSLASVEDTDSDVGQYNSIAIGIDGLPVISYYDATADALKVAKCNDVACTGGNETITLVDYPLLQDVGQYTSIAIGADGFPVISYFDNTRNCLKVAKCNDAACAGADETLTTVDNPANEVGTHTSIAIGSDGFPVISYHDATAGSLKVARCLNASCTSSSKVTVDNHSVNTVGIETSIAIGNDGLPVVSYLDDTANVVKVAKCGNAGCSQATITTFVDLPAVFSNALAIGADGFPVIASYVFEYELKVVKCMNQSCWY